MAFSSAIVTYSRQTETAKHKTYKLYINTKSLMIKIWRSWRKLMPLRTGNGKGRVKHILNSPFNFVSEICFLFHNCSLLINASCKPQNVGLLLNVYPLELVLPGVRAWVRWISLRSRNWDPFSPLNVRGYRRLWGPLHAMPDRNPVPKVGGWDRNLRLKFHDYFIIVC